MFLRISSERFVLMDKFPPQKIGVMFKTFLVFLTIISLLDIFIQTKLNPEKRNLSPIFNVIKKFSST